MKQTRPIKELLDNVKELDGDIAAARDRVQGLESLREDVIRSLRKAGYKDDIPAFEQWDFSDVSIRYVAASNLRIADYFLMILAQADRWMSERELYARAKHIGLRETKPGDFKRSLAPLAAVRRRKSDGYIGLKEWPDSKP